ncbi:MAG: type IV pilus biogenesis/stability protein PilW [Pseudomonadota bacterium]
MTAPVMSLATRATAVVAVLALGGCASLVGEDPAEQAAAENTRLGLAYMERGEPERAEESLKRALEHDPDHVDAHHYLGELQRRQGAFGRAEEHYRRALALDDDDPALHNNHGVLLCARGDAEAAARAFERAAADRDYDRRARALENAGDCHLGVGDPAEAAEFYRRSLDLDRGHEGPSIGLARARFMAGDRKGAEAALEEHVARWGEGPAVDELRAELADAREKETEEAQ